MAKASSAFKTAFISLGLALCALLSPHTGSAQLSTAVPRIAGPVDESTLTQVRGTIPGLARAEFDRGEASPSTAMSSVRLLFSRTPEQQAALDTLMADQIDPTSPNYHHWITPQEFGRRFGPADSDVAAVTAWLQSHGLQVDELPAGRTDISFSGTVSQIQEAFRTPIHTFERNGVQFLSNTRDPQIPAAIAPVIATVAQMNTIRLRPMNQPGGLGMWDNSSKEFAPAGQSAVRPKPELTTGTSPNFSLYVVPADAATIYNTPNSYNANFSSGTSYNGSGVKIGIAGDAVINPAIVADYRTRFLNGDTTQPTIFNVNNTTLTTDSGEAYLDNELAGGLAPGAAIYYYTSPDLWAAIQKAINDNTVDILSISFGACEAGLASSNAQINTWMQQASTQGIAVTVSTGDSGSAGCDASDAVAATAGLAVNGLSATQHTIAVGGTDYAGLLSGFTTYVNTTNNSSNYGSAKTFIPESTWNNSTTSNGLLANNIPAHDSSNRTNIQGGGGGKSTCATTTTSGTVTTCSAGWPKPSFQRGTGVPGDGVRDQPDISLLAGNGVDGAAWLVCTDDTGTVNNATVTANCTTQADGHFYFAAFGGTSTSAPAFAGMLALVQQKMGSRLGGSDGVLKNLYDLFNSSHATAVFHDVTQGNISVTCQSGSADCVKNTAGNNFMSGFDTNAGYDLATGIGSVDVTQLINFWATATGTGTATVTVTPGATSITANQSLSVTVTVSGSAVAPSGTVTLSSGTYASTATSLATGSATIVIPANSLAAGTDTLTATYSGDITYATAKGTVQVAVAAAPTATITITPASSIVTSQSLSVPVTVSGSSGTPTGSITLSSGSYTSSATPLVSGAATVTVPANTFPPGTATLKASYSGDGTYGASSNTVNITVKAPYSMTATAPSAISRGGSATSTITITADPSYTGTLSLACSLTSGPTNSATDAPACAVSAGSSVTVAAGTPSPSTATVTITTTAAQASLQPHNLPTWLGGGSGAVLALLVFLGIPARRRSWRNLVGLLALFAALGSISACGGGGGGGTTTTSTPKDPGTSSGAYVFTVTATGNPAVTPAPTTTVSLTVN